MTEILTDKELTRAVLGGDAGAYAFILRRYQDRVYSFLLRLCGNPADAEDALQETFIKAFEKLSSYNSDRPLLSWLFAIAHNAAVDAMRRRGENTVELETEEGAVNLPDGLPPVERLVAVTLEMEAVEAALARVPAQYREALLLHAREELSYEEICGITGASLATVKIRIYRARQALERELAGAV